MNQQELTVLNVGQNLDDLMNLDPRGYGVCRILYKGARDYTGKPLTVNAAEQLIKTVKKDDLVYIITGFVLLPFKKAEMDGIVGSMLLARALVKAFEAKPVIVCPVDNLKAVENLAYVMGLHLTDDLDYLKTMPLTMGVKTYTKDPAEAEAEADKLIAKHLPSAVIAVEAPGRNAKGVAHNATGLDVTEIEAKSDVLFAKLQQKGVLNIAIGDLGNEIGMAAIKDHILRYIPYAREGACRCGCEGGILAATAADHIVTATTSDWGAYGIIAALAYLLDNIDVAVTPELEREALVTASRSGMIDMYGWLIPAVDGFNAAINVGIAGLMYETVKSALSLKQTCATWFEKVLELGFYQGK